MNSDFLLLNEIYQNSITAVNAMSQLLAKTESEDFFDFLFAQMREYREIANNAYDMLTAENFAPSKPSMADKSAFFISVRLASGRKSADKKIAKILIDGSIEGIYDITDFVNNCTKASKNTRELAYELIKTEERNIQKLKEQMI